LVLLLVGVVVAMIVNRDLRGDRRSGPIVLAGTIGGLLMGVAVAYLLSPSTFRFKASTC
jgi:threonine/homoserine/homoserine lactone efflux protein